MCGAAAYPGSVPGERGVRSLAAPRTCGVLRRASTSLCSTNPCFTHTTAKQKHNKGLHGATVLISGRRQSVLDEAVAALSRDGVAASSVQGDVRQQDACDRWVATALAKFGRLDILVNCAAGNFLANAAELSQGGFRTGERRGDSSLGVLVYYAGHV